MWESDKDVLRAYKECYSNLLTEMREGGEVELGEACVAETTALLNATKKASEWYKDKNPVVIGEKKQGYYKATMPFF